MALIEMIKSISAGGVVAVVVILMTLVQVVPCKIDPWTWLGDQLNKNLSNRMKDMEVHVDKIEGNLNAHIVESYRNSILDFSDNVMRGKMYTHDKWKQMLKVCASYDHMIETYGLINGDATEAIKYIQSEYQIVAHNKSFSDLPKVTTDEKT